MKRLGKFGRNGAILLFLLVLVAVVLRRPRIYDRVVIHVTADRPLLIVRELTPSDLSEIAGRVRQASRRSDLSALRRFGLRGIPTVVCRQLFERIREMEIERDGSVTVLARSTAERPPTGANPNPAYSGYGRTYRAVKETNGWQVTGTGGFTAGSKLVTISYTGE